MHSKCAFNVNFSLLRRYIQAFLVPVSGNKKYAEGASAAGICAGAAYVLAEHMPNEFVVQCTGHELRVGWCS
jgi:hypothetical protein